MSAHPSNTAQPFAQTEQNYSQMHESGGRDEVSDQQPSADTLATRSDAVPLIRCPNIIMLQNTPKGRGIFATSNIVARTVIDVSPVLVFDPEEYEKHVGKSKIWFYSL